MEINRRKVERSVELKQLAQAAKTIDKAVKLLQRMESIPMSYVLSKVPGATIVDRSEALGVSRQTYYFWMQGRSRPSLPQAERLAELTGITVEDIMSAEMTA
jgi:DNA-binding XRE family transcriptional regulator